MFGILADKHMNQQQILAAEHETGCKLTKGNKKFQKCVSAWKKAHPALSVTSHCPCRVCARRMPRCSLGCRGVPKQHDSVLDSVRRTPAALEPATSAAAKSVQGWQLTQD